MQMGTPAECDVRVAGDRRLQGVSCTEEVLETHFADTLLPKFSKFQNELDATAYHLN